MSTEHKLTFIERWMLSNQYRLIELTTNDLVERQSSKDAQTILKFGYESLYPSLTRHIFDGADIFSCEQGREVEDILHMFDELYNSYSALSDKADIKESSVRFSGFSDHEEASHLGFTAFLCEDSSNYASVVKRMRGDGFNSHLPMLESYRRMLAVWRPIKSKLASRNGLMTQKEIKAIVDEQTHPDNRIPRKG